jgi:hypothetical protein
MNKKDLIGKNVAKPVYLKDSIPYSKEKYSYLDHYLINCPDCGAKLTVKLWEDLRHPDETIIEIVHSEHKS